MRHVVGTVHFSSSLARAIRAPSACRLWREIYHHPDLLPALHDSSHIPFNCTRITASSWPNCDPHAGHVSNPPESTANMFRSAILRSAAVATRTAVRPTTSAAARRFAVAPVPRVASFVPKTVAWQAVRCYASGSSLDKVEVYERIKQLLSGFDKVGFGTLAATPGGGLWFGVFGSLALRLRRWMGVQDNERLTDVISPGQRPQQCESRL